MTHRTKYIILSVHGKELPILFTDDITHNDLNRLKVSGETRNDWERGDIISGGFIRYSLTIKDNRPKFTLTTYGESTSAGVKSRPKDADIIATYLGLTDII